MYQQITLFFKMANRRKRILLVDDDEDTLTTYKLWLELNNFQVHAYSSTLEILRDFKKDCYDLLLLNIRMPEMSGFELYRKIREIDSNVKACFITSFEMYYSSLKEIYPDVKNFCFVQKPLSMERLLSIVTSRLH